MDAVSSPPAPAGVGAAKCVAPEVEGPDVVDSGRALQGEKERTSDRGGSVREEGRGGEERRKGERRRKAAGECEMDCGRQRERGTYSHTIH